MFKKALKMLAENPAVRDKVGDLAGDLKDKVSNKLSGKLGKAEPLVRACMNSPKLAKLAKGAGEALKEGDFGKLTDSVKSELKSAVGGLNPSDVAKRLGSAAGLPEGIVDKVSGVVGSGALKDPSSFVKSLAGGMMSNVLSGAAPGRLGEVVSGLGALQGLDPQTIGRQVISQMQTHARMTTLADKAKDLQDLMQKTIKDRGFLQQLGSSLGGLGIVSPRDA